MSLSSSPCGSAGVDNSAESNAREPGTDGRKRQPQCGYCRFHPEFEKTEDGRVKVSFQVIARDGEKQQFVKLRKPIGTKLQSHGVKCERKKPDHWRKCKPCSNLAFRNIVMAAQKQLKTLGVNDELTNKLQSISLSQVLKEKVVSTQCAQLVEFVDERKGQLRQLIRNPVDTNEVLERLVDAFLLLDYLTKKLDDVTEARLDEKTWNVREQEDDVGQLACKISINGTAAKPADGKKAREPKCEPCKIYWHTKTHAGKSFPQVKNHKRDCLFSLKNNPGFVKHCVQLLLLTSKQNIMKEQIACRRDNEQNVENLEGKYEKLVEEKNQEYIADRNRIRNKILTDPESLIEKIEGPDNRGFLSFIALLLFRDDTGGKKKQSPRKVKCEPPPCPAASPPSPSSPLVRSKAAIPLSLKHEEHFSFHDMPRTLGVKRGPEETKFLSIASASPAKRHRDRETGIKVTVSGNSMPEKETPQPLDLRVNKEKMAAASAAPSLDQRDNLSMDALYYNWHVRMMILGQQAMIASQHHTPASLSHLVPPHALWLHDPAAPHPTLRTQQLSLPQVNYFQRLASLTLDPIP